MLTPCILLKIKSISVTAIVCSVLFCLLISPLNAFAIDYYVKTSANGGNNAYSGFDWNNAKATIGAAMALMNGDDNVYVAMGIYNEKVTFPSYNNIALRGGYPATGGATQDPSNNPTIIDGTGLSSPAAMISIPMQPGGTSGYFGIVIDGFTIRNGTLSGAGCAGIESYSLGVTITRNIIENNQVTGTDGWAGGIYIFGPLNDNGKAVIERNIIRNNAAAAVGGIYLDGASDKAKRYVVYLANNLIVGNQSTTTDPLWNPRGVGGIDIMYPASASIVNCTIADNTAVHPTNAIGGVSIGGYPGQNGIAAIANSIIWHPSGKDILAATDGTGTLWIAYSDVKDTGISGTGVIHADPQFVGAPDYHLTSTSPCKNTGSNIGTVLTGTQYPIYGTGFKNYGYTDAQVSFSWGDGIHALKAQWQYDISMSSSYGYPVGRFFGTSNANCTADPADAQIISNMSGVDASTYSYANGYRTAKYNSPWIPKETIFWRGTNGYYGAWLIDAIAVGANSGGLLRAIWYFQVNGSPYFDSGIRTVDLEGKTRPAETVYDMGAYEYAPDTSPPTGTITINGGAVCTKSANVTLNLSATDPSGVAEMQFSNDNSVWLDPEAYGTSKSWILSSGAGMKTVYVKFKDSLNYWSNPYSATIKLPAVGDLNLDGNIDLADALIALQVTAGLPIGGQPNMLCSDINNDMKIGLGEAIYILQTVSGLRQ
jgi:hypothetical protein